MKRLFAIVLALMLVLSLAACKEQEPGPGTNGAPGGSSTNAPDSTDTTDPTVATTPPDAVERSAVYVLSGVKATNADGTKPYEYKWETQDRRLLTSMTATTGGTETTLTFNYRESERSGTVIGLSSGVVIDFSWDEEGRIISRKETSTGGTYEVSYVYDAEGRCTGKSISRNGELASKVACQYEDGKLTKEITTLPDGSVSNQKTCVYNENGDLTEETAQWGESEPVVKKYTYTYNDKGQAVARFSLDAQGTQTEKRAYTYDAEGRVLSETVFNGDTRTSHTEYTYDENGNLAKEQQFLTGEDASKTVEHTYTEVRMSDEEFALYQMLLEQSQSWY